MLCERLKIFLVFFVMVLLVLPSDSYAVCSSPAGAAGEMGFDLTGTGKMEYCNDTSWVEAGVIAPVVAIVSNMNANLVGHWRLDETSGASIADSAGSNTGTWSDNVNADVAEETATGILATALAFDGAETNIALSSPAALDNIFSGGGTITAWFMASSAGEGGYGRILEKATGANSANGYSLTYMNNTTIMFWREFSGGDAQWGNISTSWGVWHHIAIAYDDSDPNNDPAIYLDGSLVTPSDSNSTGTANTDAASNLVIGNSDAGDRAFDGSLDDVRIYDRALSVTEIAYLYASTKDLVGHWTLDETSGTSISDGSGNANTGTFSGEVAVVSVNGKIDTAIEFDAVDDEVNAGSGTTLDDVFSGGGSLSTWIYPETYGEGGSYGRIASKGAADAQDGWQFIVDGAQNEAISFHISCDGGGFVWWKTTSGTVPLNQWSHVVVTFDRDSTSNTPTFYVNGSPVSSGVVVDAGSSASCGTFFEGTDAAFDFYIGQRVDGNRTFDGYIDDVRLYDRALVASEVFTLYQQAQNYGLVGHWKLDETSGTSVADSSGNGNTGTFSGEAAVVSAAGKIDTALSFDGSDDYIGISDDETLDFGTGDFSFATWVNVPTSEDCSSAGNGETFIGQRDSSRPYTYLACHIGDQYAAFEAGDSVSTSISAIGNTPLNDGAWHHVTGVKEGHSSATIYIYVDGVLQNSTAGSFTGDFNYNVATPTSIGRFNVSPYYNVTAVIDEARMYNRALSASEIAQLSICTKPGEMGYNFGAHVLQWCDVVLDAYNAGTAGAGGVGCAAAGTKIAGVEGGYQYDTTSNKMVFCDGVSWVDIPN